ncbi:uncharacterized protein CMU_010990 [Cryptosporidium muris RN66]|uniref:TLC domain-containing protein n=1 Tax=Cryptosporidium muris (strain RN66) TaxID=441375 RepID=B6AIW0_CRYMR|nr:uncharacterized protein CMU_010990 [Cryptosporidium muris RN66]EEA08151.1 hypothetical protein, conserved [Cryptosporidium muris RN66]|eukprot:XP_002142500.1 hypothetical protein [Cryptosporidium muris RN66]
MDTNTGIRRPYEYYNVAIYCTLSCLFFHILESIPTEYVLLSFLPKRIREKINEELKKKERIKAKHLRIRGIAFIHAIISSLLGLYTLLLPTVRDNPYGSTPSSWIYIGTFSLGYFLWDIIIILRQWRQNNDSNVWLFHGIVSFIALFNSYIIQEQCLIGLLASGMVTELSTILLSIKYCYYNAGDNESRSCKVISYLFVLTFFLTRNVLLLYQINIELYRAYQFAPSYRSKVYIWFFFPIGELFNLLNIYWLIKIITVTKKSKRR